MKLTKHIPNAITCLNLFSGILATIAAYNAEYDKALFFVLLSAVFDFFDGFMARLLKAYSPMGKELDSLADVVSFGLVPGMVAYKLLEPLGAICVALPYAGFLITIFSALRLAKFNIDERQTSSFIGLATPANALFWLPLACAFAPRIDKCWAWTVLAVCVLSSYLLVCELPMFSLKIKSLKWRESYQQIVFLTGVVVLLVVFKVVGLSYAMVWYVALSLFFFIKSKVKK